MAVLILNLLASVLGVLGIGTTAKEYRDGRARWRRLSAQSTADPAAAPRASSNWGTANASITPKGPLSLEDRVERLETRLESDFGVLRYDIARFSESVPKTARHEAAQVERRLAYDIGVLTSYVSGQYEDHRSRLLPRWWIGPALLASGVVVGGIANIAALYSM